LTPKTLKPGEADICTMVSRSQSRSQTRLPAKVVDRRCPLCLSPNRDTVDRMIGIGESPRDILEYCEAHHIQITEPGLETHRQKHWTAIMVNPPTIEDAKHLNPNVKDINEVNAIIEQNNRGRQDPATTRTTP